MQLDSCNWVTQPVRQTWSFLEFRRILLQDFVTYFHIEIFYVDPFWCSFIVGERGKQQLPSCFGVLVSKNIEKDSIWFLLLIRNASVNDFTFSSFSSFSLQKCNAVMCLLVARNEWENAQLAKNLGIKISKLGDYSSGVSFCCHEAKKDAIRRSIFECR